MWPLPIFSPFHVGSLWFCGCSSSLCPKKGVLLPWTSQHQGCHSRREHPPITSLFIFFKVFYVNNTLTFVHVYLLPSTEEIFKIHSDIERYNVAESLVFPSGLFLLVVPWPIPIHHLTILVGLWSKWSAPGKDPGNIAEKKDWKYRFRVFFLFFFFLDMDVNKK